jgi:hypothetical protein
MVPVVFDPVIGRAADEVAGHREKLHQECNRVRLAVRLDGFDRLARETLKGGFVYLRPCRNDRYDRRRPKALPAVHGIGFLAVQR